MKLLKFSASWCQPCKALSTTIKNTEHVLFETMQEIDVDANPDIVKKYSIRGVPTLLLVDELGNEIKQKSGNISKEILLKFLNS